MSVQYLQRVCAHRSRLFTLVESGSCKTPSYFAQSVPTHRDKAEIKCMGPVGGKHQQNQKCISNLKHSEQDKVDG